MSIKNISNLFPKKKIRIMLPYLSTLVLGMYGLIITSMLISLNLTSFHYQTVSNIAYQIQNASTVTISAMQPGKMNTNNDSGVTILGNNYWLWIPKYIFDRGGINDFRNYYNSQDNFTKKVILVVGEDFASEMTNDKYSKKKLKELLAKSVLLSEIKNNQSSTPNKNIYPFNILTILTPSPITRIEIRSIY